MGGENSRVSQRTEFPPLCLSPTRSLVGRQSEQLFGARCPQPVLSYAFRMTRALTKAGYSKFLDGTYLEKITISYMVLFPLLFLHMQQLLLKLLNSSHSSSSLL